LTTFVIALFISVMLDVSSRTCVWITCCCTLPSFICDVRSTWFPWRVSISCISFLMNGWLLIGSSVMGASAFVVAGSFFSDDFSIPATVGCFVGDELFCRARFVDLVLSVDIVVG
jgi:hypothetical protein